MSSLKIAGVDVENVQVGSTEVQAVYVGETEIWSGKPHLLMNTGYDSKRTDLTPQYPGHEPYYDTVQYGFRTTSTNTLGPFGSFNSSGMKQPVDSLGRPQFDFSTSHPDNSPGHYIIDFYSQTTDYSGTQGVNEVSAFLTVTGWLNNDGWTTVTSSNQGRSLNRADASYQRLSSNTYPYFTRWTWTDNSSSMFGLQLFGSSGQIELNFT